MVMEEAAVAAEDMATERGTAPAVRQHLERLELLLKPVERICSSLFQEILRKVELKVNIDSRKGWDELFVRCGLRGQEKWDDARFGRK